MSASNHPPSLGKYEIRGTLGKGAMGTVYDGWDKVIDRRVAIKTVRLPDANDEEAIEGLARFKREAQAAGRLTHPNIVGVFDYGETEELAYIVMEFVEGRSLKEVLSANERMSADNAVRLMEDVLAGLSYSHGRGVVHRDIKPANIMMAGDGGSGSRAKIADFGIARIEASSMTQAGTVLGTPAYMSPEQFMGQVVDRRTDIYSCGVMLYQLLAGERPFEGSMTAIMHKALTTTPPRPSELAVTSPASLDGVVAKAMARRPEDRYDTAADFAAALRAHAVVADDPFASDETIVAVPKAASRPAAVIAAPPPKRGSRMPVFVGAGAAVVAVAAAVAWFLLPGQVPPAGPATRQAALVTPPAAAPQTATPQTTASQRALPPIATAQSAAPAAALSSAMPSSAAQPIAAAPSATPEVTAASAPAPADSTSAAPVSAGATPEVSASDASAPQLQVASAPPPQPITARQQAAPALPASQPVGQAPPPTATVASQDAQNSAPAASPFLIPSAAPQQSAVGAQSADVPAAEPLAVTASADPASAGAASLPSVPTAPPRPEPTVAVASPPPPHAMVGMIPPPPPPPAGASAPASSVQPALPPQRLAALAPVLPPAASAPIRSAAAIQAALSVTVPSAACSLVRTSTAGAGIVTISGVSGAQPALREAVAAAEPVDVAWQVQAFDGPYCPALDLLRTVSEANRGRAGLDLGQIGGAASLTDNAVIALRATMPGFGGYLHVAYLQHDSTVSPLVPGPGYPLQTYAARAAIDLGKERPDFPGWHVGPPFGTDMIVAVATTAPLFSHPLPDSQPLPAYLASLQTAMSELRRKGGSLAAAAVVLDTRPSP